MSVDETKMEPLPTAVAEPPSSQETASTTQTQSPSTPVSDSLPVGVRIRPKICDVRDCASNSLRNPEILFVSVPGHSYPERRFVWLTLMQAARDKKRSYCCSRHFTVPDDFKDFREFISAPPGYKRQLLVKKGVVPHLNMPPLNMPALPPLTDRWQMTLPQGMTETDQLKQNAARSSMPLPIGMHVPTPPHMSKRQQLANKPNSPRVRHSRAVQTERLTAIVGPRKVPPSLQYCRLCFKRQDLEPIFTGDQTLIEPDLIDKIFGCTEVLISVERDFPSSICTGCYTSVQEFVKFRKLVQLNDESLRGIPLPPMSTTPTPSPSLGTQTTSVRTKTTETIPLRPVQKLTPLRQVSQVSSPVKPREDPLLEVQRVENVKRYQRRQQTIERNQPLRAQRMQETLYPVPYRRPAAETTTSDDPLASANDHDTLLPKSEISSAPEGVQLNDRIVPVTLIRVQAEATHSNEDVELQLSNTIQSANGSEGNSENMTVKIEETTLGGQQQPKAPSQEGQHPLDNTSRIRAKPLHQLVANPEQRKSIPTSVLQAVKLLPSATAKALANQKSSLKPISTLTRGITSGRFSHQVWKPILDKGNPKPAMSRMLPKAIARAVRFPGTMTTVFSGSKKQSKPSTSSGGHKSNESPKSAVISISNQDQHKPQVLKEMKLPVEPTAPSPIPKPKTIPPADQQPQQKENSVPESPQALTSNKPPVPYAVPNPPPKPKQAETPPLPPVPTNTTPPSPRSSRIRKVPLKFKDSIKFPMPQIITIKTDPDSPKVESPKVPQETLKELPTRTTRRSNVTEEKPSETQQPSKTDRKQTEQKTKQSKEEEPPKNESAEVRPARRSEIGSKISEKQRGTKALKRKSDTETDPIANNAPPPSKSAKVEPKRNSLDVSKPKNAPSKTSKAEPKPKRASLDSSKTKNPKGKETPPPLKSKLEPKSTSLIQPKTKQKQKVKLDNRANGSRKSEPTVEVKQKKLKEPEASLPPPVSSQDWKCPFCPNKVFDQKKGLVKHLRKRHGMDYALVRQRLAIYGGNWR